MDPEKVENWHFVKLWNAGKLPTVGLDVYLEIAQRVGIFLNCFSVLDVNTAPFLSEVMGISDEEAGIILGVFRNYRDRLKLIGELLSARKLAKERHDQFASLLKEMEWAVQTRNKYAHAQYGFVDEVKDKSLRVSWLTDSRKTTDEIISAESVQEDVDRAKCLLDALFDLLAPARKLGPSPGTRPDKAP